MSLSWPAICQISRSIPHVKAKSDSRSRNNDSGWAVEKTRLMPASADVLSLTDGTRSGMRPTENSKDAVVRMEICAKVSQQAISFYISSEIGIPNKQKSLWENFSENHLAVPNVLMKPPIWQKSPLAHASAANSPMKLGFGHIETWEGMNFTHLWKIAMTLLEEELKMRRFDLGSRMLHHMTFSSIIQRGDWLMTHFNKFTVDWDACTCRSGFAMQGVW